MKIVLANISLGNDEAIKKYLSQKVGQYKVKAKLWWFFQKLSEELKSKLETTEESLNLQGSASDKLKNDFVLLKDEKWEKIKKWNSLFLVEE